ncbi:phage tail tape measure protein [Rhizobium puerariae]|uniref:Phage tail tape measure protein n=1 Tax=Rhizobium puerariae TaxID=1585791 RepID=A0ABV6AK47_9HYPH
MTIKEAVLRLTLQDAVTANALKASRAMAALDKQIATFTAKRNAALADFRDAAAQAGIIGGAITLPVIKAAAFESSLEEARQKIAGTVEDMRRLNNEIRGAGVRDSVGARRAAETTDTLLGLGADQNQARNMSSPINRAATAYRADSKDLAQAVYSSALSFGIASDQTTKSLDIMAESGKRGAVELKDMAARIPSLSAQYAALGQKGLPALADLTAQLQVVRKATGGADEASVALQNFYSSLTGPEASKRLRENGIVLSELQDQAAKTGGSLVDLLLDKIQEKTGGNAEKLGALFPDRESQRAIRPLMQNRQELGDIRSGSLGADGTVERDFQSRLATLEGKWNGFMARLEEITLSVADKLLPAAKQVVDVLTSAADRLDAFIDRNGDLILTVTKTAAALLGFRLAVTGARVALWAFALPAAQAARSVIGFGAAAFAAAGQMIALQTALKGGALTGFQTLAAGLRGLVLAIPGVGALGAALAGVGAALATVSAPVWLGIAAAVGLVAAAGAALWKYWDRVSSVFAGIGRAFADQLSPALQTIRPALDALAPIGNAVASGWERAKSALAAFGDWISSFFQREVLSDAQKSAWERAGYDAAARMVESIKGKVSELVSWFAELPGKIIAAVGRIELGSLISWPSLPSWLSGGQPKPAAAAQQTGIRVDGARARGGSVSAGKTFLVGEKGPELFQPGRSGAITANDKIGGAVVNVHAPVTLNVSGASGSDLQRMAREAAQTVVATITGTLDRQLNRGAQVAFSGISYGDK